MKKKTTSFQKDLTRLPGSGLPEGAFLTAIVKMKMEDKAFEADAISPEEVALDLVYQAQETEDLDTALEKVETALLLDAECIPAYEFLGNVQELPQLSVPFYAYGVDLGRKRFGGEFLKKHKGHFWLVYETRPFMRCLYNYGRDLYLLGRSDECRAAYREILDLNPSDNQGVRYELAACLLEGGDVKGFERLREQYREEASALLLYSDVLYAFMLHGADPITEKQLKKAMEANPYVIKHIVAPDLPKELPYAYQWGSREEAKLYASFAWAAWQQVPGAAGWLKTHLPKTTRKPGKK
jgi:tetratricopeptide (TPR) repeat protein